jgi:hypothetical protein
LIILKKLIILGRIKKFPPYMKILFLVLTGVLGCAEDWEAIISFGETKLYYLLKISIFGSSMIILLDLTYFLTS